MMPCSKAEQPRARHHPRETHGERRIAERVRPGLLRAVVKTPIRSGEPRSSLVVPLSRDLLRVQV